MSENSGGNVFAEDVPPKWGSFGRKTETETANSMIFCYWYLD